MCCINKLIMYQIGRAKFLIFIHRKIHDPLYHIQNQIHIFYQCVIVTRDVIVYKGGIS
jgi:hypothetical protein